MNSLRPFLRVTTAIASLVATACLAGLWVHSHFVFAVIAVPTPEGGECGLAYSNGDVLVGFNPGPSRGGEETVHNAFFYSNFHPSSNFPPHFLPNPWGQGLYRHAQRGRARLVWGSFVFEKGASALLLAPFWAVIAASIAPGTWIIGRMYYRRSRRQVNRCLKCGYDLRHARPVSRMRLEDSRLTGSLVLKPVRRPPGLVGVE